MPRWRTERVIVAGALVAVVVTFAAVGILAWVERDRALDEGARAATRLAHVLDEQTARAFQAVDLTLAGIVDALRLAPALPEHDPVFLETLRRKQVLLPQVRALFVVAASGHIIHDTDDPPPSVRVADPGYVRVHADNPDLGLHIGPPVISRAAGAWFVSLSRRIDAPDGGFNGIAVAAVEPRYVGHFYRDVQLGPDDSIALFARDGTLIARHPHHDAAVGTSFGHLPLFHAHLPARPAGTYRTGGLDERPRIVSYRTVDGLPLVVTVGLSEEALLEGWWRGTLAALVATSVAVVLIGVLALLLVRHARQREVAREQLAQARKLEALGRMTGGIAHDFGNVLAAIGMNLEVLRRTQDPRLGRVVEATADAVRHGMALASRLLAFARRQPLHMQAVDVNRLVAELEPLLGHASPGAVAVTAQLAPDLWPCRADESQLAVALVNLVMNSRDAMEGRTGRVRIVTENWPVGSRRTDAELPPGDYVRVSIVDDGAGMPPHVRRRATEPFFTTKGDRGTGLGLSQVYGFVRQVGGALRIESEVGAGTSVHMLFPRAPEAGSLNGTASGR